MQYEVRIRYDVNKRVFIGEKVQVLGRLSASSKEEIISFFEEEAKRHDPIRIGGEVCQSLKISKIHAIKRHRELTGSGLREAIDYVDNMTK